MFVILLYCRNNITVLIIRQQFVITSTRSRRRANVNAMLLLTLYTTTDVFIVRAANSVIMTCTVRIKMYYPYVCFVVYKYKAYIHTTVHADISKYTVTCTRDRAPVCIRVHNNIHLLLKYVCRLSIYYATSHYYYNNNIVIITTFVY